MSWLTKLLKREVKSVAGKSQRKTRLGIEGLEDRWAPAGTHALYQDITIPVNTQEVGMLLPAVQKVREAAARVEGNTYYVGTANGGVWKTTDGGTSWGNQGWGKWELNSGEHLDETTQTREHVLLARQVLATDAGAEGAAVHGHVKVFDGRTGG